MSRWRGAGPLGLAVLGGLLIVRSLGTEAVAIGAYLGPPLVVETPLELDLGNLWKGEDSQAVVVCTSNRAEPFTIQRLRTTCGCTLVRPSSNTVGPGDVVQLFVTPNTWSVGLQGAEVYAQVDDWPEEILVARVSFSVVDALTVTPSVPHLTVADAGNEQADMPLVVRAAEGGIPQPLRWELDRPGLEVREQTEAARTLMWIRPNPEELAFGEYYVTVGLRAGRGNVVSTEHQILVDHRAQDVRSVPAVLVAGAVEPDSQVRVHGYLDWDGEHVVPEAAEVLDGDLSIHGIEATADGGFDLIVDVPSTTTESQRVDVLYTTTKGTLIGGLLLGIRFSAADLGDEAERILLR